MSGMGSPKGPHPDNDRGYPQPTLTGPRRQPGDRNPCPEWSNKMLEEISHGSRKRVALWVQEKEQTEQQGDQEQEYVLENQPGRGRSCSRRKRT